MYDLELGFPFTCFWFHYQLNAACSSACYQVGFSYLLLSWILNFDFTRGCVFFFFD
uniref:Uncharacterized protein n=1 Tax=Rhizophora mucronata TaxID=61149 RepID=A0A2P2NR54_RHIMU